MGWPVVGKKLSECESITADELSVDDYIMVSHLELDRETDTIKKTTRKMRVSELVKFIHSTLENGPLQTR